MVVHPGWAWARRVFATSWNCCVLQPCCVNYYREGCGNQTGEKPRTKPVLNKVFQTPDSVTHWKEDYTAENGYHREKLKIEEAFTAEVGKDSGKERSFRPMQNNESWHLPVTAHFLLVTQWPENNTDSHSFLSCQCGQWPYNNIL